MQLTAVLNKGKRITVECMLYAGRLVIMSSVMWGLSNFFRIMCLKVAESILRCQEGKVLIVYKDTHIKIREIKKKKIGQ